MLTQLNAPTTLSEKELDLYLAHGWFRMGQAVFTTNFIKFHGKIYSAIWLRVVLASYAHSPSILKLYKQNQRFRTEIKPLGLTQAHEVLFETYRQSVAFQPSESIQNLLENTENDIFTTYEINLYDDTKLIATGYFDLGETSAEGISCFYDPAYKKFSLSRYLMYQKIDFCKKNGFDYFYSGYFVPHYKLFDYKLNIANAHLEFFQLSSDSWQKIEEHSEEKIPFEVMQERLKTLRYDLEACNVESQLLTYEFFDVDMIRNFNGQRLFDFPIFLRCFEPAASVKNNPFVVFDVRDANFHVLAMQEIYEVTIEINEPNRYSSHLLRISRLLYSSENPADIVQALADPFLFV